METDEPLPSGLRSDERKFFGKSLKKFRKHKVNLSALYTNPSSCLTLSNIDGFLKVDLVRSSWMTVTVWLLPEFLRNYRNLQVKLEIYRFHIPMEECIARQEEEEEETILNQIQKHVIKILCWKYKTYWTQQDRSMISWSWIKGSNFQRQRYTA